MLLYHAAAFFGTVAAFLRTAPAVIQFLGVALALFGAGRTYFEAGAAKQCGIFSAHAHEPGRGVAYNGAFPCQRNATGKHFYVILFQAFRGTVLAFYSAVITRFNATFKGVIIHNAFVYLFFAYAYFVQTFSGSRLAW
jgi:hypothetical protein